MFGLLVLGLDRFKVVQDSLGPLAADRLLVAVAKRLQVCLRSTDVLTRDEPGYTLARLEGNEFNVMLDDITDVRDAVQVAARLRRALEAPFDLDGHQVFVSATVGIAISSSGYTRADEILRDGAVALNRATASGTTYEIFDPAMRHRALSRLQVETDLRKAIDNREFELHYQPIISLPTGRIAGFESLARWHHPLRGHAQPGRVHPDRRRHRHDRRPGAADAGRIVPADGGVAGAIRPGRAALHVRQPLEQGIRRHRLDEGGRQHPRRSPAWAPRT